MDRILRNKKNLTSERLDFLFIVEKLIDFY